MWSRNYQIAKLSNLVSLKCNPLASLYLGCQNSGMGSLLVDQGNFGIVKMAVLQLILEVVHFGRETVV
jgi:hypothetical protein